MLVTNPKQVEACQTHIEESKITLQENIPHAEPALAKEGLMHFYNGQDCANLQNADIQKVRELQDANDKLQRQVLQLERDMRHSNDALALLAEKERCQIIIARNTGEILKIQMENDQRLKRIAQLEAENELLKSDIISQRNKFIETHDMEMRPKHAAGFFLSKSQLEKNNLELIDLTQE